MWPGVKLSRRRGEGCPGPVFSGRVCKYWCFDIAVLSLHGAHSYVSVFDSRAGQKRFFSVGEKWQHLGTALLPVKEEKKILNV